MTHEQHATSQHEELQSESTCAQDELGTLLGERYTILRQLGKGGQGSVYLAENTVTHQLVSIKQVLIKSISDWKQYELFHREADFLQPQTRIAPVPKTKTKILRSFMDQKAQISQ